MVKSIHRRVFVTKPKLSWPAVCSKDREISGMQHFIQASTTSGQTGGGGTKADDFQQGSTFVKMMLDKKAKQVPLCFKILS